MTYARARENMVESQLRTNRVTDGRLLEAFATVPRELFVPEAKRGIAYIDEDIAIAPGRYLMEPMVLARLLQAAELQPADMVLEVGSGTGYASAVVSHLVATVVALESEPELHRESERLLGELGIDNVVAVHGELSRGCPEQGPHHVILISGAVSEVPEAIARQLAEGGRLITVRQESPGIGRAVLMQRAGGVLSSRVLFDAATPLLPEFKREPGFVF